VDRAGLALVARLDVRRPATSAGRRRRSFAVTVE
jgi:hypothetical protein